MIFCTQSGSVYEVDNKNKCIRRLNGKKDPTLRQGKDGEWKEMIYEIHPIVGLGVRIFWKNIQAESLGAYACTETSMVTEIIENTN